MSDSGGVCAGIAVITLAVNLPGPLAAFRLGELGAEVVKVEPPGGDPLASVCGPWYERLAAGQVRRTLDLKDRAGRAELDALLAAADLLITASRPASLERLGLAWDELRKRYPSLCQVAIVGYPAPDEDRAGHDLTYQAECGLVQSSGVPRTLIADLAGAERAVSAALALLLRRERSGVSGYAAVALADAAKAFAEPIRLGLTVGEGALAGYRPDYTIYPAREGWVAVACLEPRFRRKLLESLRLERLTYAALAECFLRGTAREWELWAAERDLPIRAVL